MKNLIASILVICMMSICILSCDGIIEDVGNTDTVSVVLDGSWKVNDTCGVINFYHEDEMFDMITNDGEIPFGVYYVTPCVNNDTIVLEGETLFGDYVYNTCKLFFTGSKNVVYINNFPCVANKEEKIKLTKILDN